MALLFRNGLGPATRAETGGAFGDEEALVGGHVGKFLHLPAGPANLQSTDDRGIAQAEVERHVVLRIVTAAAHHFVDLAASGLHHDAGADGAPVGFGAGECYGEEIPAGAEVS